MCVCREGEVQHRVGTATEKPVFHTLGVVYRPRGLRALTCLVGGGIDRRVVYKGFELRGLNSNAVHHSHVAYSKYLEQEYFVPPIDNLYWSHVGVTNILPNVPNNVDDMGLYNVFPLDLSSLASSLSKSESTTMGAHPPPPPSRYKNALVF